MEADLFSSGADNSLSVSGPLAERMRPSTLDEVVGQKRLVGPDGILTKLIAAGTSLSVILWGPPGSGKTTLARLIASKSSSEFESVSAVSGTVSDIRAVAERARRRLGENNKRTILFVDEIHRFTKTQQDALLPHCETGLLQLIGATTESPWATVNAALLSRCTIMELKALDRSGALELIQRANKVTGSEITEEAAARLAKLAGGDARRLLTIYETANALAPAKSADGTTTIADSDVENAVGVSGAAYGKGEHYDSASALIKHMRASDPEQAVAWFIHMIDGGEDPMFIARRLVIFASEDVGLADSSALQVATAALEAVRSVGLPEAKYPLAHAVLVLSNAPKSRAVGDAMAATSQTIRRDPPGTS